MILTPKAKEYGKRLQVEAVMYINRWTKRFKASEETFERDMDMIFKDARDLYKVGALMAVGDFHRAMKIVDRMDTLVRDEIPRSIYNYLWKFTHD